MEAALAGVFFDLDDTLIATEAAVREALRRTEARFAPVCPALGDGALTRAVLDAYAEGFGYGTDGYARLRTISVAALRRALGRSAFARLGIDDPALEARAGAYCQRQEDALLRTREDARDILNTLRRALPVGVITNGPSALQRRKLRRTGLAPLLDTVVVDTEEGWPKPDPRLFARAAQRFGRRPGELMFVGNSPADDVAGARGAGWTSVWLGEPTQAPPEAHHAVARLTDLLRLPRVRDALRERAPDLPTPERRLRLETCDE